LTPLIARMAHQVHAILKEKKRYNVDVTQQPVAEHHVELDRTMIGTMQITKVDL
jgi:hypothetical protein